MKILESVLWWSIFHFKVFQPKNMPWIPISTTFSAPRPEFQKWEHPALGTCHVTTTRYLVWSKLLKGSGVGECFLPDQKIKPKKLFVNLKRISIVMNQSSLKSLRTLATFWMSNCIFFKMATFTGWVFGERWRENRSASTVWSRMLIGTSKRT